LDTSDADAQPPAQVQLDLLVWHPGGDLLPLEEEMRAKAAVGDLIDHGEGPFALAEMQAWDGERTVRALVLRHLLIADEWPVDAKGVRLRGVRISGHLDLEATTLRCPMSLESCYLDAGEPVSLDQATASRLVLTNCQLAGLTGDGLSAREVDLSGSTLSGAVSLVGADTRSLICSGAQLQGLDETDRTLIANGIKVRGDIFLNQLGDKKFTAAGSVWLFGADVTGQLNCTGAQLGQDKDGNALAGDAMKVGGGVMFNMQPGDGEGGRTSRLQDTKAGSPPSSDQKFTAAGTVRLHSANIMGPLECSGAQLSGPNKSGDALLAEAMKVGGSVQLDKGFTAAGTVHLVGADIAGGLFCNGAQLKGPEKGGVALLADAMKVGRDVFLDEGFTAAQSISLRSATVGGSLLLGPDVLPNQGRIALDLDAAEAQITGKLSWKPAKQVFGQVNLEGASVGELEDDWRGERGKDEANAYWPTGRQLHLDGLTYKRFAGDGQATVKQRLKWIQSQFEPRAKKRLAAFATQPYEQLAAVYRQAGQDSDARKVAIARRADLRKYGSLNWYRRFGNWFLDRSIGYGYKTWRAAVALAAVFVIFWTLSILAQQHHLIVPVGSYNGKVPSASECTSSYPCFYPAGYTVDTVIPIINVHQAQSWGPDGSAPWGRAFVAATWIATGLGWALATLLVAGYTGLVRQD
jgi:uncharacterized protein YjbI with pentapeptide repeats